MLAEREGFEPSIRGYRIHTFQACSFNHSDTSPRISNAIMNLIPQDGSIRACGPNPFGAAVAARRRSFAPSVLKSNRRLLTKASTPLIKQKAPRGGLLLYWRWVQSAANLSLPISLIDGKIQGKSTFSRPVSAPLCRQPSVLNANFCDLWTVSKIRNRELTGKSLAPEEFVLVVEHRWRTG